MDTIQNSANQKSLYTLIIFSIIIIAWIISQNQAAVSVPQITVKDAYDHLQANKTVVLDVRGKKAYEKEHLPNAVSIPLDQLDEKLSDIEIDKAEKVVVYCNDGSTTGPKATKKLNDAGYTNAVNMKGGIEKWRAAKFPTVKP